MESMNFLKDCKKKDKNLDKIPLDPLTGNEYTLSVSGDSKEYQIASAYEWDEVVRNNILDNSYAGYEGLKARLIWNYNWKVKLIRHNWYDYALALPSIVSIDISDTSSDNLQNILNDKKLTYDWYNSLPASYWQPIPPSEWSFDFTPAKLVVWSWSLAQMAKTWVWFSELSSGLYSSYIWTNLYLKWDEYKYINSSDVLKYILKTDMIEWDVYKNCSEIKEAKKSTQNGCYSITWSFINGDISCISNTSTERFYCNMEKDWWGWTMYAKIKWNYSFEDAKNCVYWEKINNSNLYCTVPFAFGKNKELWYEDLNTDISYVINVAESYNKYDKEPNYGSFYKSPYFDSMFPTSNPDNPYWIRLWFNFMNNHSVCWGWLNPGGVSIGNSYMNYDWWNNDINRNKWVWDCSWPKQWWRESTARKWEFYVR